MKKSIYILFFVLGSVSLFAQAPYSRWLNQIGGSQQMQPNNVAVVLDSKGNLLVGGYFQGNVDFDFGPDEVIKKGNYFVQKLTSEGELIWVKVIETNKVEWGGRLTVDGEDNVYFCGSFYWAIDFDPGPDEFILTADDNSLNSFIVKLTSEGDFVWAKNFGTKGGVRMIDIAVDEHQGVFATGSFTKETDFDPGPDEVLRTPNGESDIFTLKLDESGNLDWVATLGGSSYDYSYGLDLDPYGNVFTVGYFNGYVDFDPGADTYMIQNDYGTSGFVQKLGPEGDLLFAQKIVDGADSNARGIFVSDACEVYIVGDFLFEGDFNVGEGEDIFNSIGKYSTSFIQKLDCDGNYHWTKIIGVDSQENGYAFGNAVFADQLGQVFYSGFFRENLDLDPGPDSVNVYADSSSPNGQAWGFLSKLDKDGNYLWGTARVGGKHSYGVFIRGDNKSNIYCLGGFGGTVNFHPNLDSTLLMSSNDQSASSAWSLYLQKIQHCDHSFAEMNVVACESYRLPSGRIISVSGTYVDTILNTTACDSIMTFDVEIVLADDLDIVIQPNPTSSLLTVSHQKAFCEGYVKVFSMNGQLLLEQDIDENQAAFTISVEHFPQGQYVLLIGNDDKIISYQFQKL